MNTTYLKLLQIFESFASAHLQVQRFKSDFTEQLQNFGTQTEQYPILYVTPEPSTFNTNDFTDLSTYTFRVYALDVIQKDRANINTILNNTSLILNDLHKWLKDGEITGIDVLSVSTISPINNYALDYLAGWQMTISIEVETYSVCEIPFRDSPIISVYECDITYNTWQGPPGPQGIPGPSGSQGPAGPSGSSAVFAGADQQILFISGSTATGSNDLLFDYSNSTIGVNGDLILSSSTGATIDTTSTSLGFNGVTSVNWSARQQYDSNGVAVVQWDNGQLLDQSGILSQDWFSRAQYDSQGLQSVDYEDRLLFDSLATASIDYDRRRFYDPAGTIVGDWLSLVLSDLAGTPRVDWGNGVLYDANAALAVDWNQSILYDPIAGIPKVDWFSGTLSDNGGTFSVDWEGRTLVDNNAITALDWELNHLKDNAGSTTVDWHRGRLIDASSTSRSLDWSERNLRGPNGQITLDWANNNIARVTGSLAVTGSLDVTGSAFIRNLASTPQTSVVTINATTGQLFLTASSALGGGGVTQLLAGPNITLSPTNGLGQVTITSTGGGGGSFNTATGSYGSFYDTTTQTNLVANIPRSMSLNTTDITNGVSISGSISPFNTYIKTENAGVYNIQFSAQLDKTDSGADEVVIWLRKNGINLTDTATTITLIGNNGKQVAAWNWFVNSAANDYYQIIWQSADTNVRLLAEPADGHPGIPSVIVTANRVDQFLSNTGSFSGSFTGNLIGTATTASYISGSVFTSTNPALSASYALTASFALNGGGGGATILKKENITFASSSWVSQSLYVYTYTDIDIAASSSIVDYTPNTASFTTVVNAIVYPTVVVTAGTASFFATNQPSNDITGELVITNI